MKALNNKGFSVVEMMACVAIFMILATGVAMRSGLSTYNSFNEKDVEETIVSCANLIRLSAMSNDYANEPKMVLVTDGDSYYLDLYLDGISHTTRAFLTVDGTYVTTSASVASTSHIIAFDTTGKPTTNPTWVIGQKTFTFNQVTGVVQCS